MLRRLLSLAMIFMSLALTGCKDSPTSTIEDTQSSIITASVSDDQPAGGASILFGSNEIDTLSWGLGQDRIGGSYDPYSVTTLLGESAAASLISMTTGASGIVTNSSQPVTLKVFSDWAAVEPNKHEGVTYGSASEFYFRIETYPIDASGAIDWSKPAPTRFHSQRVSGQNPFVNFVLPRERSIRFVFVAQRRLIGCSKNDSLELKSEKGLVQFVVDEDGSDHWQTTSIQDITIQCSVYKNGSASDLRTPVNLMGERRSASKPLVEKVGNKYFMRLE